MRGFPRYRDRHEFPTACAPDMGPYRVRDRYTLSFYRYTRKAGGNLGKGHLCLNVFPLSPQEGSVFLRGISARHGATAHLFLSSL